MTQTEFLIQDIIQLAVNIVKALVITGIFYELGMPSDICLPLGTAFIIVEAIYCIGKMIFDYKTYKELEENIEK